MKVCPLIVVEWVDSAGGRGGWVQFEDLGGSIAYATTVGYLVKETDEMILLVSNFIPQNNEVAQVFCNYMGIPKCAIKKSITIPEFTIQVDEE